MHDQVTKLMDLLAERLSLAQTQWFCKWKTIFQHLTGRAEIPEYADIMADFHRDLGSTEERLKGIGIIISSQSSRRRNSSAKRTPIIPQPESPPDGPSRQVVKDDDAALGSSKSPGPPQSAFPAVVNEGENDPRPSKSKGKQLWSAVALHDFNLGTTRRGDFGGHPYMIHSAGKVCLMHKTL